MWVDINGIGKSICLTQSYCFAQLQVFAAKKVDSTLRNYHREGHHIHF